jgi:hypothetical protein
VADPNLPIVPAPGWRPWKRKFPPALSAGRDPLLAQILVFRLRLLAGEHHRQRQALQDLLQTSLQEETAERCRALLAQEGRALKLLGAYEAQALGLVRQDRQGKV